MRVLAVAPHPDDELIGAGGALIKHARQGDQVWLLHVVGRERTLSADISDAEYAAEVQQAAERLGAVMCACLDAPSRDLTAHRAVRMELAGWMRKVRPHRVYLPHAQEADSEHRVVHELVRDALWMASANFFPEAGPAPCPPPDLVLAYEVWTPMAQYSYVVDITDVIDAKLHAMRSYASQLKHASWDAAIEGLARYRGAVSLGRGCAEVFGVISLRQGPGLP